MKALNKSIFVLLLSLMAISALGIFSTSVTAQTSPLNIEASISTNDNTVGQATSLTYTIRNTGTANIGSVNITVPNGPTGYHNVAGIAVTQQPAGQTWNATIFVTEDQTFAFIYLLGSGQGLAPDQSVTFSFDATNAQVAGIYTWTMGLSQSTSPDALNAPELNKTAQTTLVITSLLPALAIVGIAFGIALLNSGLNRVLINYFVGWEQYHVMQKEMNEHRQAMMAAARANDKKQIEKLKRKDSQIKNMQGKMMKPQMLQFGISFVYLIVWFLVLTPTFQNISMAYLPGFGPIPVFYLYPAISLFLGLIASRLIGIMPIEPR